MCFTTRRHRAWERKTHLKLWICVFTSTQTFKKITAFSVPKFVVGLSCHWYRFLYFARVVCRSSPIHSSHVAFSRPCRLSEFTPNRASDAGLKAQIEISQRMCELISAFATQKFWCFWKPISLRILHPKSQKFHHLLSFTSSLSFSSKIVSSMMPSMRIAVC